MHITNSTSQQQNILIRNASEDDAAAIVQVHYDAVHVTASKDYDEAILKDWSGLPDARIDRLQGQIISNPENTSMLVAEINGEIVGFGEIVSSTCELRAVYVSPIAARNGVGGALLNELEAIARKKGVLNLWLDSSLTAEPFYLSHGYLSDGRGEHHLQSGRKMICVKMHKCLTK
jgi:N-acetylglutamate synthase-like GNAT family acetyltransferase